MVESLFIIIARRRETEQPRERKRAPSSFLAYSRYENRKTDELRNNMLFFVFRDRSDDAFGTISESQKCFSSSSLDAEKPNNRESANAPSSFFFISPRAQKEPRPMSSDVPCYFKVFRDRSDDAFGTISDQASNFFIIIARYRETEEPRERKPRAPSSFFLYLSLIRDTKTERPMSSE